MSQQTEKKSAMRFSRWIRDISTLSVPRECVHMYIILMGDVCDHLAQRLMTRHRSLDHKVMRLF